MIDFIKHFINILSSPTISFTLLTVLSPFLFPPTDWFEKYYYKFGFYRLWKKEGGYFMFIGITLFLLAGYTDEYAVIPKNIWHTIDIDCLFALSFIR